jgi:hypothetical protein
MIVGMPSPPGPILVLFARPPRLGVVKTRLAATLGEEAALDLYRAFLRDSIALMRSVASHGIRPAIFWSSREAADEPALGEIASLEDLSGFEIGTQDGEDLGQRMSGCLARLFSRGHDRVALIGADTPTLPARQIVGAFGLLRDRDFVLGPSRDGGTYFIGARCVVPEVFQRVPWGTGTVYRETLSLLKILGYSHASLPEWSDVDTVDDLETLRRSLAEVSRPASAGRHTRAALERLSDA